MTRPLLVLVLFSSAALAVSLQCEVGTRVTFDHPGISYPPSPVLTTCPPESRCCKKESRPDQAYLFYCCSTDCPEDFGGKTEIVTPPNPTTSTPYIARCTGPNGACGWGTSIGFGCETRPHQCAPNINWPKCY